MTPSTVECSANTVYENVKTETTSLWSLPVPATVSINLADITLFVVMKCDQWMFLYDAIYL